MFSVQVINMMPFLFLQRAQRLGVQGCCVFLYAQVCGWSGLTWCDGIGVVMGRLRFLHGMLFFAGILVAKKHLFSNPTPDHCGGGTVFFVSWMLPALFST